MYFAMDDMGDENVKRLTETSGELDKWRFVQNVALDFGFTGLQVSPKYRDKFGFSLAYIPRFIRDSFRVTYHPGGIYELNTVEEERALNRLLTESLEIGIAIGAEDVSIHPPLVADVSRLPLPKEELSSGRCAEAKERLGSILDAWLPKYRERNITLSLETHFTPAVFVYDGPQDFRDFCLSLPNLGVLVDVSHNYYDGYQICDQLDILKTTMITGSHLSDAIRGKALQAGTHLPIGQGHADFESVLRAFGNKRSVYGALEVRGPASGIKDSLAHLRALQTSSDIL